jgi:hypothetical protein
VKNGRKIGITGYFLKELSPDTAGLRWHGIVQEERGYGYSTMALKLVADRIASTHKAIKYLAEALPTYRKDALGYFKGLGFVEWNDTEKEVDYASVVNLRVEISRLMERGT